MFTWGPGFPSRPGSPFFPGTKLITSPGAPCTQIAFASKEIKQFPNKLPNLKDQDKTSGNFTFAE